MPPYEHLVEDLTRNGIDVDSVKEKLAGIAPSVALHIPWGKTDDWPALKQYAGGGYPT